MKYIIFRDDGIGDLIVTTEAINLIKKSDNQAKILIICSNRNVQYADILKKSLEIDNYINSDKLNSFSLILKIRNFKPDISFIFNNSSKNISISFFSQAKRTYSILPLNSAKNGKDKYKTPLFLTKFLFNDYEIIDCRNSYKNSSNIHMSQHFVNLVKLEPNIDAKEYVSNYISPSSLTNSLI